MLTSERGVQQGDPLGPALFAIAIHPKILKVKAQVEHEYPGKMDFSAFYLDDGILAGTDGAVARFAELLRLELGDLGLELTPAQM